MNDDIFKKLKNALSGSSVKNKNSESIVEEQEQPPVNEELVQDFMNQILDASWVEEDLKIMCKPSFYLSNKNNSYWLMNTTIKTLMNIKSGIEIIPIEDGEPNSICLIGQSTYSIPNDLIICAGWN